ncbi:general transcription factor 2-related zincfinger protein [Striga asiatica]|uniref:General transcription factor 2-related zincfinger protein n=1 Tax=Striga asiatica TaxID=4170 RepID=A0A5A7PT61_STRAF|nr:general transcription factor 2-related zincfinger protein [Striga asiatica]
MNQSQGIHWKKWNFISLPKEYGGLAFQDLQLFYKAMICKQLWRIISNPDLLVSRLLKERIEIRNGVTTRISYLNWVPGICKPAPTLIPLARGHLTWVKDLMQSNGAQWNDWLIKQVFDEIDSSAILKISTLNPLRQDRLFWALGLVVPKIHMEHQPSAKKGKTPLISSFFRKWDLQASESTSITVQNEHNESPSPHIAPILPEPNWNKTTTERDPGKRKQIALSSHTMCVRRAEDLMIPSKHIDKVLYAQSKIEKERNRLRLKSSIMSVRWLALQGFFFRGNDESSSSSNRGNFIELIKAFANMNAEVNEVVL